MKLKTIFCILSLMLMFMNNSSAQKNIPIFFDGVYRTPEEAHHYHLAGSEPETKYMRSYLRFYPDGTLIYIGALEHIELDILCHDNPIVSLGKCIITGDSISFDIMDSKIQDLPFLYFKGLISDEGKHLELEEGTYYNGDHTKI